MPCWKSSWTEEDKEPSDEPPWHHRTDVTRAAEKELLSLSYLPALFATLTYLLSFSYLPDLFAILSPLSAPGYQPENL